VLNVACDVTSCLTVYHSVRMVETTTPIGGGGYEYQFMETPLDMFVCKICQYPSREPYLSGCCGHTFCKPCLEAVKRATTITKACPMCRDEEFITMPHKQADRARSLSHVSTSKMIVSSFK